MGATLGLIGEKSGHLRAIIAHCVRLLLLLQVAGRLGVPHRGAYPIEFCLQVIGDQSLIPARGEVGGIVGVIKLLQSTNILCVIGYSQITLHQGLHAYFYLEFPYHVNLWIDKLIIEVSIDTFLPRCRALTPRY